MPITIPDHLPSRWMLESEGIFVLDHGSAARQDLMPLRIVMVDLAGDRAGMLRLARLIANSPLHIELALVHFGGCMSGVEAGTADAPLPAARPLEAVLPLEFDGLVASHAPHVGSDWHATPIWDEYRDLLDWSAERVRARMFLGWSAQAALAHIYGLASAPLAVPAKGVFPSRAVRGNSFLLRGFDEVFPLPARRDSVLDADGLADTPALQVLAESPALGPTLVRSRNRRDLFVLDHPDDEPADEGMVAGDAPEWRSHATLLFLNWLNYYVYQPFSRREDRPVTAQR